MHAVPDSHGPNSRILPSVAVVFLCVRDIHLELADAAEKADLNSLASIPMPFAAARMSAGSGAASAVAFLLLLMRLRDDARRVKKARAEFCFEGG